MKRTRYRGKRNNNSTNRTYESNSSSVKVKGNASAVFEKYQALASDATSSGDYINAENYFQHAEHYFRIIAQQKLVKAENQEDKNNTVDDTKDGSSPDGEEKLEGSEAPAKSQKKDTKKEASNSQVMDTSSSPSPIESI